MAYTLSISPFPVTKAHCMQGCGVGVRVVGSRRFLDGVGVGLPRILGVGVGIFDPTQTPKVQLNHFSTCFACLFLLVWPM